MFTQSIRPFLGIHFCCLQLTQSGRFHRGKCLLRAFDLFLGYTSVADNLLNLGGSTEVSVYSEHLTFSGDTLMLLTKYSIILAFEPLYGCTSITDKLADLGDCTEGGIAFVSI